MAEDVLEEKKALTFEEAMQDKEFAKAVNSFKDSAVSKGVESYKVGNFEEAVKKAVEQRLEDSKKKTPEQLQIEEMSNTMKQMQSDLAKERLEKMRLANGTTARTTLENENLPKDLANFIIGDTEEETKEKLDRFIKIMKDFEQGKKTETLKKNNIKVPEDESTTQGELKEPGADASKTEWMEYWKALNNQGA